MASGIAFVVRLLKAFLTGLGVATGVNLFLFPISSRDVLFREVGTYLAAIDDTISAHLSYVESLGAAKGVAEAQSRSDKTNMESSQGFTSPPNMLGTGGTKILSQAIRNLTAINLRLAGELKFAKREVTYGYLDAKDIDETSYHLRAIYRCVLGLFDVSTSVNQAHLTFDRHEYHSRACRENHQQGRSSRQRKA